MIGSATDATGAQPGEKSFHLFPAFAGGKYTCRAEQALRPYLGAGVGMSLVNKLFQKSCLRCSGGRRTVSGMREIHGKRECPFAWRVRVVAREKGLPFEWVPFDVDRPDPRAAKNNPERRSPKLVEDGFELTESLVILEYLDEAYPERPLQALGARERAQMRLRMRELGRLEVHATKDLDEESRAQVKAGWEALERMLADGRQWLGGSEPDLSDVAAWPFLALLDQYGHSIPPDYRRASAYWSRVKDRDSLVSTRPR